MSGSKDSACTKEEVLCKHLHSDLKQWNCGLRYVMMRWYLSASRQKRLTQAPSSNIQRQPFRHGKASQRVPRQIKRLFSIWQNTFSLSKHPNQDQIYCAMRSYVSLLSNLFARYFIQATVRCSSYIFLAILGTMASAACGLQLASFRWTFERSKSIIAHCWKNQAFLLGGQCETEQKTSQLCFSSCYYCIPLYLRDPPMLPLSPGLWMWSCKEGK